MERITSVINTCYVCLCKSMCYRSQVGEEYVTIIQCEHEGNMVPY